MRILASAFPSTLPVPHFSPHSSGVEGTDFLLSPIYSWEPSPLKLCDARGQALGILLEETKENVNHISQQSVVC